MTSDLVLIIEDDPEIVRILQAYFERDDFRTISATDPTIGIAHHQRLKPDLVILDVKMPKMDGYEVLASIRRLGDTPVIMLTALAEDLDKLQALRMGADDYVVKPFNPLEVVARARAILRRVKGTAKSTTLRAGTVRLDTEAYTVTVETSGGEKMLAVTPTEFRLLATMMRSPNRVHDRGELVDACLPEGEALNRTVDSHMSNLRRKLAAAGLPDFVVSVRGVGYRLDVQVR